jgi:hypothetical protein
LDDVLGMGSVGEPSTDIGQQTAFESVDEILPSLRLAPSDVLDQDAIDLRFAHSLGQFLAISRSFG